jgi:hypothetical protein
MLQEYMCKESAGLSKGSINTKVFIFPTTQPIMKLKSLLINSLINFCNIMWNYIQVVRAIKQASAKKITYWEVAQGLIQKDGIQGRLFPNFKTKLIVCRELSIL